MSDDQEQTALDAAIQLITVDDNRQAALQLAQRAERHIYIFSHDLEPAVYDTPEFSEAVLALARSQRNAHIHILVLDTDHIVKSGHRLVNAMQHLPDKIRIRVPSEEFAEAVESYLIVDDIGYLFRKQFNSWEGIARIEYPPRARELSREFQQMWERAQPDSSLTRYTL